MGNEIRRADGLDKVTGNAVFPGDIHRPGLWIGRILHSTVPHARIVNIETSRARALPGVIAVITGRDFPDVRRGMIIQDEQAMTRDKVRYYGEPIAAVAAIDARTADQALDLIEVEMEELPGIFDFERSIDPEAPLIHEEYEAYTTARPMKRYGNVCLHTRIVRGDIEKGFAESDRIFEDRYTVPVVYHAPMEPKAIVAERDRGGRLRLWCTTARPFAVREGVAHCLGLPMSDVRVTAQSIGGHFGGKGEVTIEPIAAMLAMKAKGAVKLEITRREDFLLDNPRHPMEIAIKTGVKKDGTLLARQATVKVDTGAFSYFGPSTTSNVTVFMTGPYRIPHLHIEGICAYTNKLSCGPCRAPGAPQAHFAVETHLDRIARDLGLDPFELRLKNALVEKDSTATGQVLGYVGYREALLRLKSVAANYIKDRKEVSGDRAVGVGIAGGFWGMAGMGSSATLKLNEDGTAVLSTGAVEIGAGSHTAMAILISEGLGIPMERIKVVGGDTDTCPYDFGAIGSRTTQAMGVAVHRAIEGVRNQLLGFAENHLDAPREMLTLENGKIHVRGRPELSIPIAKAVHVLTIVKGGPVIAAGSNTAPNPPYDADRVEGNVGPTRPFFCFGAQAAIVEVDKVTGKVNVLKILASHNVGKAVFPAGIEGQIQGGVAMGLGYALSEEALFSDGKPVNVSFLDYRIPTMEDVPEIVPIIVEKENGKVPDDIRGVGEPPTIPTAAAVANAIHDAVGIRLHQLPLTPERVFWEMEKRGGKTG
jgi:CO/xanthine dehydrogenase Mo-binding subunit